MAKIKSFPNNQDEYIGAEDVMRWLHGRTSGVFGANKNASVVPVLDAMGVTVSDGHGWLSNEAGNGVVWWVDNEAKTGTKLTLPVDMADGVLSRIDRVVVSWETTNYVAPPEVSILKGTPSSIPTPPALTNSNTMRQISLARIAIPAGTTAITSEMITDERLDASVCGIVTEQVGVDTSVMQAQFEAMLAYMEGKTIVPIPSANEAGMAVIVNPNGNGYVLDKIQTDIPVTSTPEEDVEIWIDPNDESIEAAHVNNRNNPHGVTIDQIGAAPAGYGLGGASKWLGNADIDTVTANGWYTWNTEAVNAPFPYGSMLVVNRGEGAANRFVYQIAFCDSITNLHIMIRKSSSGAWGEWEHQNPPMAVGVEYRTTERWKGEPVYQKIISVGTVVEIGDTTIEHGIDINEAISIELINSGYGVYTNSSAFDIAFTPTVITITSYEWRAGHLLFVLRYTKN